MVMHKQQLSIANIEAFEKEYSLLTDPFRKVDLINTFTWEYIESMEYSDWAYGKILECQEILAKIDYPFGKSRNFMSFCYYYWAKAEIQKSMEYGDKSMRISKEIGDTEGEAFVLQMHSFNHSYNGRMDEAFRSIFGALKLIDSFPDSYHKGFIYYGLGLLYHDTANPELAMKNYEQALSIFQKTNFMYGIARCQIAIGSIYIREGKRHEAVDIILQAIEKFRYVGHKTGLARALNDLGVICRNNKEYEEAEKYLSESYKLREQVNHVQGIITTSLELGRLMTLTARYAEAIDYLNKALKQAQAVGSRPKEYQICKALAEVYNKQGRMKEAYDYLQQYISIQMEVAGQDTARRLQQMETKMATEKAEKEAEIERLKNVELKNANQIIKEQNNELKDTIDELTKARISRKAISITLVVGIVLFILSEGFLDPFIDQYSGSMLYSMGAKLIIALMLKPVEGLIEKIMLSRVVAVRRNRKVSLTQV
jgi:tetratricopeptide (TPR) repeat protein